MSVDTTRVSWPDTAIFVLCFAVAVGSCRGIGDAGDGARFYVFWTAATCCAAAFQFGIGPARRAVSTPWPPIGWLLVMIVAGIAIAFGGCAGALLSGAVMAHGPLGTGQRAISSVAIVGIVVGIAWAAGAVLLVTIKAGQRIVTALMSLLSRHW
jgi:hypothetical protein